MAESADTSSPDLIFEAGGDNFNGRIIKPSHYGEISVDEFRKRLTASIAAWKSAGRRGVWLTIPLKQSELIPVAAELGFEFHHTKPDSIMMTRWLPENEPNTLPIYASHNIGVGGFVVNERNEVLLVQEKWLRGMRIAHWKLPGGVLDPGEDIWQTAMRETLEETGIRTEFVCVLSVRHMHKYNWGIDDLYFTCLLRPLNTDIQANPNEIAEAKWMNVDEYIEDPKTFPGNKAVAQAYKEGLQTGFSIQPVVHPHFIPSKPPISIYRTRSCDVTQPCDLGLKEWAWKLSDYMQRDPLEPAADKPKSNI